MSYEPSFDSPSQAGFPLFCPPARLPVRPPACPSARQPASPSARLPAQ